MILVTGGAGFIGANFVLDWIAETGEAVVNLDKLTYAGDLRNVDSLLGDERHVFVRGDICDRALLDTLLTAHRPRAIVHLAAETHVDQSIANPVTFTRTNVDGTLTLLEAARAYWSSLGNAAENFRFLQVSTDEVYGSLGATDASFVESSPYGPNNPYAATKAAADHLVRAYHHTYGLPTLITHCSNNFGPFQFPEKFVPLIINHALTGKPIPIYGDGLHVRDWLFVGDHCRALRAVLTHGRVGETYNLGARNEMTNLDLVNSLCAVLDELKPRADGRRYGDQIRFVADRPGHDRRYGLNPGKAQAELHWRPIAPFATNLHQTVRWYVDHGIARGKLS